MTRTASVKSWVTGLASTPRRRLALAGVLAAIVAVALAAVLWRTESWELYSLEGTGLIVELPAPPEPGRAGAAGDAGPLFQVRCPELAVVASGGPIPPGSSADPQFLVRQAMALLETAPGITELRYQVGKQYLRGQPCLMVGGTFRRDGAPSRLMGAFFVQPAVHGHVLCFWSDRKGARMAGRVMRSLRVARP